MVQMLKALIVPGVLAVAGCCWWWYSSRKKTPGTSQDSEKKEDELSSSSGEEQCAQSETRAPLSSPEELPLQDSVEGSQLAEISEQEMQLEEPIIIIDDPQSEDTPVSVIELPELSVVEDLSSSSEDGQCAQSSPEELPLQDSVEDSQPDGQCALSSPEELPLQDSVEDSQPAWSSEGKRLLEEPIMDKEDPPTKGVPASFLGRKTKPRVLSTSVPLKPFFIRDKKYENTRESLSQVAWDTVMDDWY
ncbi:uncharacterized protein LOC111193482 [Astyanax mexicanus]|uniref:uncharacterized protein LOC111193482 n=1 Tax=Astyanax mexicanus TaxID=7994 RepID=UPI0020CABB3B|nr:uncharacterized protein LOC111193482 [Astyanax mexicanus]